MGDAPWADWVGRSEAATDTLTPWPARALAATLDRLDLMSLGPGDPLPAVWTWLYFLAPAPTAEIGADGHPKRGGFLPPVPLPRRMWAGSRCVFHAAARLGETLERVSTIASVAEKAGRAGPMVFVTVHHALKRGSELLAEEEQEIVYVGIPETFAPPPPTPLPEVSWREARPVDPVLLFRFSALTFNGHRIHYDRTYATEVERYPGLVVHGPLQAVLLFDAATRRAPGRTPARFRFRSLRPLFDFEAIAVAGRESGPGSMAVYTVNGEDAVGMEASIDWR